MRKFLTFLILSFSVCTIAFGQAANDSCSVASPVSIPSNGTACVTGTTVGGAPITWTTQPCGPTNWPNNVWYTFVSTGVSNTVIVTPTGSPAAQKLGVTIYMGSCDSLIGGPPGSCVESTTNGGSDTAIYPAPVGTLMYVDVSSFVAAGGFQICITSTNPPAAPGTTCATATRLCNEGAFTLAQVPAGGTFKPSCFTYQPQNGVWYQFTVGVTGQLSWECTPTTPCTVPSTLFGPGNGIELDWAMYDITNGCPTHTNQTGEVDCNYNFEEDNSDPVGMSSTSTNNCSGPQNGTAADEFCPSLTVTAGETYAIFINNYTNTIPTGWNFNFSGSTFQMAPVDTFLVSPDTICGSTGTVTLTNNSIAAVWQKWSFGDGTTSALASPGTHTYSAPGSYFISLEDSSQSGCTAVASKAVLISAYPVITLHSATICPGGSGTLTASVSNPGGTYLWSTGATTAGITASPATTTSYTVTYTSTQGCSATASATITVNSNPTTTATASPATICLGQTSTLTAGAAVSYSWSTGATASSITVVPSSTTTYTVTATLTGGCTATATVTVTIANNTTASITPTPASVCPGQSSVLAASTGTSFTWSTGATTQNITVTPANTTNYEVTVTVTGTCTATATTTVTVLATPTASITPSPASICPGQSSTLTASAGSSYVWSTGATTASITVSPTVTTPYKVTVTISGTCTASAASTITVNPNPAAAVNPVTTSICPGQNTTLTASGGAAYLWSNTLTTAAITVTPASTTTYSVTVASAANCTATASGTVTVSNTAVATINPTAVTICGGLPATLTAGGPTPYLWSTGSTAATISPAPVSTTVYTLTVGAGTNCSATGSSTVTVDNFTVTVSPATTNSCTAEQVTLTCSYHTNTYSWSNGNATQGITVYPTATTTYTVSVSDANNCTATASAIVNVDVPTVTITPAQTAVCSGQSATLVASGSNSYAWSNGDFNASNTVSPTTTTTYVVTATDAANCTVTDSATVTIGVTPIASFTVTSPVCVGQNSTITFTGTASPSAVYTWGFEGGTIASGSNGGPYKINWGTAETVTVSLAITDNGCIAVPDSVPVTINAIPASSAGNNATYCSGNTVTIGAASVAGYTYLWSPAAGLSSSTISNPTVNLTNTQNSVLNQVYTVTTSNNGCTSSDSVTITVDPVPVAQFTAPAPECLPNNNYSFVAGGTFLPSAATFAWTFGANATPLTSTQQSQTVIYSAAQTTAATLIITQFGCISNTALDSITINPVPVAGFSADTTIGCPGQLVCFTNTSAGVNTSATYLWNFGDGGSSTLTTPCHTYNNAGVYTVELSATNSNCSNDSTSINLIKIVPGPVARFTPSATIIQQPQSEISFTNQSTNALNYIWNFGGLGNSTDVNPVFNFTQYGLFNVVLNAYNTQGCADSTTVPITVLPPQNFFIPNAFTPNDDGNNDNFYIQMQEGVTVIDFTVFDRWGEKVHDGQYPWDGTFKGKPCPEGVYVYIFKLKLAGDALGIMRTGSVTLMR